MQYSTQIRALIFVFLVVLPTGVAKVGMAYGGDAQVSQKDNLQNKMLQGGNADVSSNANLHLGREAGGNADISSLSNLIIAQLGSGNADVSATYNLVSCLLANGNADLSISSNLINLLLSSGSADVSTKANLIIMLLEQPLLPQITITQLLTTDISGNTKTSFKSGEMLEVGFALTNTGAIDFPNGLISVMIQNPVGTVIFLAYTFDGISVGASNEFVFGLSLPEAAILGQYTAKALVFTNWPYEGGEGLANGTTTFIVTI